MSKKFDALGRFEVPKLKPRNRQLNDALRDSKSEAHHPKHGDIQKRSRLSKHFKHTVEEWLSTGEQD